MLLDVGGHPLHTRALGVTLTARADDRLDVRGVLVDLRKRGFVPVGGELQPSGIVHHMQLDAIVDPATRRLDALAGTQPNVAFEPTALTRGESCRDPIDRLGALVGTTLDAGWAKRLSLEIGGPRGCSHILTLAQLLGATVGTALDADRATGAPARRPGERVFRRDVIVDGHERADGTLALALQLTDLLQAPAPPVAPAMDRFAASHEVRALAGVDFGRFALTAITIGERRRDRTTLDTAPWIDRHDAARALEGLSLLRGVSTAVLRHLGERADDRPLCDSILMLAPALIQCVAALSEPWPAMAAAAKWIVGMGGQPDSCWMWRTDGPLQHARRADEPQAS